LEVSRLSYQTQEAVMGNVFSFLDASRKPVREAKNRCTMPFVQLQKSRRITSSCSYKQKFVCISIWQSAPDSAGIASY